MINDSITAINTALAERISGIGNCQILDTAKLVYDQQEKGMRLFVDDTEQKRLTLDDSFVFQSVHVIGRLLLNKGLSNTFGTVTENRYDLSVTFIVAGTAANLIDIVTDAFGFVTHIRIEEVIADTSDVLRRLWIQPMDQDKNYNPALSAVAIRYMIPDAKVIVANLLKPEDDLDQVPPPIEPIDVWTTIEW
ncbi:hypothetical protein GCM10028808_73050 [Spirosoma migulaei]